MAKYYPPLKVALMDDDFYALKWNTALMMRDPRTTVTIEAEKPRDLIAQLKSEGPPDVAIVDVEYAVTRLPVAEMLSSIREHAPETVIVCNSQYGECDTIKTAMNFGVKGFLLKSEVRMEIVSAISYAAHHGLVVSPSVFDLLPREYTFGPQKAHVLPAWKPNPRLTPQIIKSFWLRVFFGMRASLAAEELFVETATIERYVNQAYKVLTDGWADDAYLFDVDFAALSPEDQAFVWFTLPPREEL
ncbi:MAG: response regulator transcription factor [Anaerolineales bacterium]|nr:response regulator transcription factor [Anaerolineales bacterium]